MKDLLNAIKTKRLYFDGGFGTVIQSLGLEKGVAPESWNLTHPDKITAVHKEYINAGSNIITTNTFGVNCDKYSNYTQLITCAIECVKNAIPQGEEVYVAFDVGPTGKLLQPLGDLSFERAVEIFSNSIKQAVKCGVDLILIETMNDAYETKAAVVAAKECCDLPIFVTNVYDKSGKLMTGADPSAMVALLEGLGVTALGMNCSFGPDVMLELIDKFTSVCSLPLITNPNAGLPKVVDGNTVYDISPDQFAEYMLKLAKKGVNILGGCCGTTPEYIKKTVNLTKQIPLAPINQKNITVVSSYARAVTIDAQPILIGERINPTGKSKLKQALRDNDLSYLLNEGISQAQKGVHILDVNVGLPEIDEVEMMKSVVTSLQAVTDTPLQLDSSDPVVLEQSMRLYNGKPLINSVNGEKQSMDAIFPLVKKYGGCLIALTMDKSGIPESAEERLKIAQNIAEYAKTFGISKKDIIVDPLCLTISSNPRSALVTLQSIKLLKDSGFKTSLGVSNVSFGLPERQKINLSFFNSALEYGLNCAIMNPFSTGMMDIYYSYRALHDLDYCCSQYIDYALANTQPIQPNNNASLDLTQSIVNGLKENSLDCVKQLIKTHEQLEIIDKFIIPALNQVGEKFEKKQIFLPQLLMSAECASAVFEVIKDTLTKQSENQDKAVILATVKGDIHDIGKNIVKVLLESYGYKVYDLGKDVSPETVVEQIKKTRCKLVGLSALMTTTVPSMEQTIKLIKQNFADVITMVGGAVLTKEYADMINADKYCKDGMETVRFVKEYYDKSL